MLANYLYKFINEAPPGIIIDLFDSFQLQMISLA